MIWFGEWLRESSRWIPDSRQHLAMLNTGVGSVISQPTHHLESTGLRRVCDSEDAVVWKPWVGGFGCVSASQVGRGVPHGSSTQHAHGRKVGVGQGPGTASQRPTFLPSTSQFPSGQATTHALDNSIVVLLAWESDPAHHHTEVAGCTAAPLKVFVVFTSGCRQQHPIPPQISHDRHDQVRARASAQCDARTPRW